MKVFGVFMTVVLLKLVGSVSIEDEDMEDLFDVGTLVRLWKFVLRDLWSSKGEAEKSGTSQALVLLLTDPEFSICSQRTHEHNETELQKLFVEEFNASLSYGFEKDVDNYGVNIDLAERLKEVNEYLQQRENGTFKGKVRTMFEHLKFVLLNGFKMFDILEQGTSCIKKLKKGKEHIISQELKQLKNTSSHCFPQSK